MLHFQTGDSVRKRRPQPGPAAARSGYNSGPNNIRDHRGRAASKFPSFHRCRHRLHPLLVTRTPAGRTERSRRAAPLAIFCFFFLTDVCSFLHRWNIFTPKKEVQRWSFLKGQGNGGRREGNEYAYVALEGTFITI